MKFCCHLAFGPTAHLVPMARAIEEAGYDTIALSDHVVHPETVKTKYPYTKDGSLRWEPFTDWPDPWVSVGAMAAVTSRVRFVTGVYVLPLRNPFVVAKAVGTAAAISNDRVTLGIGTGWMRDEFELLEQPFERRGKRTDEMIAVLRTLWSGGMVEHHGEFYDFDRLEMSPVPSQPIPPRDQAVALLRRCGERPRVEDRGAEALRGCAAALTRARCAERVALLDWPTWPALIGSGSCKSTSWRRRTSCHAWSRLLPRVERS